MQVVSPFLEEFLQDASADITCQRLWDTHCSGVASPSPEPDTSVSAKVMGPPVMLGDLPPSAVESNMTAADNGPDAHDGSSPKAKESRKERKLREKKEHAAAAQPPVFREGRQQLNDIDDFSSAWQECKESGLRWGGRGRGGRGIGRQYMGNSTALRDICVDGVTLAYDGKELLQRTLLRITEGHRYALLGRNGVGKTTLLRRMASGDIPGFPLHLTVAYVSQEFSFEASPVSALDSLVARTGEVLRQRLTEELEGLQAFLDENATAGIDLVAAADHLQIGDDVVLTAVHDDSGGDVTVSTNATEAAAVVTSGEEKPDLQWLTQRMGDIAAQLEELDSGDVIERATSVLKGLGFSKQRLHTSVQELSGGWKMRLELASALVGKPDLLLLVSRCSSTLSGASRVAADRAGRMPFAASLWLPPLAYRDCQLILYLCPAHSPA